MTKRHDAPVRTGRRMDLGTRRLGDLETLARLIGYSAVELREIAPGCAVIANLLHTAVLNEIVIEVARKGVASSTADQ
jgi:hypothetical protein